MFYILADGVQIYKPLDDLLMLFSPKLTLEIGKAGSLEFDIPPNNPFYDSMNQLTTEVTVEMDDEEIFHGRVLSCERTFSNIRHVYCEGDLSYLIDSVQKGVKFVGTTHQLFNAIISNHNSRVDNSKKFMVGTVNIENRSIILTGKSEGDQNINAGLIDYRQIAIDSIVDEWNNTFDYIQTCLIDYCGGYLRTRRVNGTMYIDLLADFGSNAVQPIELGRNMLDLTEEVSVDELFTVLIPLGDDNLTIAAVNGGSDELVDRGGVAKYGRIVRTHVFSNVNSPYTLLENARRYMATNINIPRTITVRAIDLHLVNKSINPIHIGDKVEITSFVHDVNDRLMCTKIEYDLENPENNSYTFGNPKQTLTQRYREDKRQSNSANSPTSASATGAAAAAATAKESEKETDKALKDFYDTWVEWDDETGKVSLGAFYKKYLGDRHVLVSQCGIDLDAETGNVDITSLHKNVTDQGRLISENNAAIKIVQEDTKALINQTLDRVDHLADVESDHHTHITQKVDELSSSIELVAKNTSTSLEGMTESIATITQLADDQESRISFISEYTQTINDKADRAIASIDLVSNELGSEIRLKADKTYVDGELNAIVGNFEKLTSGLSTATKFRAAEIIAGSMYYWDSATESTVAVPSIKHSHQFLIEEKSGGVVEFRLGNAVTDSPQVQSFNIANTKYFRDHVAAAGVKIRSLDPDSYSTSGDYTVEFDNGFVRYTDGQMIGRVRITFENDEFKNAIVKIPGIRAYNAGIDAGAQTAEVKSIISNGPAGLPTYDSSDDVWYANIPITATARGIKSDSSEYTSLGLNRSVSVNVTSIYNKGKADGAEQGSHDVDFIFFDFDPDDPYWYSSSANYYYIPIKAVLENDVTRKSTFTISGQEARNSVSVTGVQYYTQTGEDTITYTDDNNRTLTAMVKVHLNNDDNNGQGFTKTVNIPGTLAYNAGRNSVTVVANGLGLNTAWSESSTGYLYETGNKRFKVRLKAELNNTHVIGATIYIPAGEAWNAGKDAGAETAVATRANISAISNIQQDPYDDEVWYGTVSVTGTAQGTYADGTKYTNSTNLGTQQVNVTAAYQKGWDDAGGDDSVVVSIDGSMSTSSTNRATITASASCGSKTGSGSYAISMSRTNSTSTSVRVNVVDNNSKVLAYTTVTYPSSTIDHAAAVRKGEKDIEFVEVGTDAYIAVVPVTVQTFSSSTATSPSWTGDATVEVTDVIDQYWKAGNIEEVNGRTISSSTYNTGYHFDNSLPLTSVYAGVRESASVYYGQLQVNLNNGNSKVLRVSMPRVDTIARGTYSASERYSSTLNYYKWTGSKGYVKVIAKIGTRNAGVEADIDVTSLVQEAMSTGGNVSLTSIEAESGYDGNTRSLFKITLSNGQVLRGWANHA